MRSYFGRQGLLIGDLPAGAALDLRIEGPTRPIGPGRLQSGILVPLSRGRLQLDQCLMGGDIGFLHRCSQVCKDTTDVGCLYEVKGS